MEGMTLTRVAEEAGLTRPLIRHHLGNRDAMIDALEDYVLTRFDAEVDALIQALPEADTGDMLLDILFADAETNDPDMIMAFAALTSRARNNPQLRERFRDCILRFEEAVAKVISKDMTSPSAAGRSAHGIVALYFNATSLAPLDMPGSWKAHAEGLAREILMVGRSGNAS